MRTIEKIALSVNDVAALTSRSTAAIWEDIRQQKFPVVRIGGRVLILRTDLLAFLESHRDFSGKARLTRGRKKKTSLPLQESQ
jgi:hypothetical protein